MNIRAAVIVSIGLGLGIQVNFVASGQIPRPSQGPVTVDVTGPLILGFFPPLAEGEEKERSVIEALYHLRSALDDIALCFEDKAATYRLDFTRSVTLRDGQHVEQIRFPDDSQHSFGMVLVKPGRQSRIVYAPVGASTLPLLGPRAAGEYFNAPKCLRRD